MKLLIATPTYDDRVTTQYMLSILGVLNTLNVEATWTPIRSTLIHVARNVFASQALEGGFSHLLFVDSDLEFQPSAVQRMLAFDKPLVACSYPARDLDPARFHQAAQTNADPERALSAALEYPVRLVEPHVREGGFWQAEHAPAGLMLIRRDVLTALRDRCPELHRPAADTQYRGVRDVLLCFDPVHDANGVTQGEDVSFCRRWRALGGEIWALMDEPVGHAGPWVFRGRAAVPNG